MTPDERLLAAAKAVLAYMESRTPCLLLCDTLRVAIEEAEAIPHEEAGATP